MSLTNTGHHSTKRRVFLRLTRVCGLKSAVQLRRYAILLTALSLSSLSGCNLLVGSGDDSQEVSPPALDGVVASGDSTQANSLKSSESSSKASQTPEGQDPRAGAQGTLAAEPAPSTETIPLALPNDPPIVARVNGAEVTLDQFKEAFGQQTYRLRQRKQTLSPDKLKRLRRAALQKLIDQALYTQHITKRGVNLTTDERARVFNVYRERFRNPKSFERFLERNGQTEAQLRASLEFDALVEKGLKEQFSNSVKVEEGDARAFYDQNVESRFTTQARVRVNHLLVSAPVGAGKRVIRKQKSVATKLYRQARKLNAQEFRAFARKHSEDLKTRTQGGDLNYFTREGLPMISREFEETAAKLKVGDVSEPIRTHLGYHLIRLTRRQKPQVRVSHILLDKSTPLKKIKEIKKRAKTESFAQLARELSIDDRTRLRQGELGFIHHERKHRYGDAFKEACLKGKKGELIGPIKSSQGQHLVFVTGRRAERLAVSHILIRSPKRAKRAQRRAALKKIQSLYEEIKHAPRQSGSLFVRLATKYSEHPTRVRGGDLGSFYVGGNPKISQSFEEAAFKGKLNKVTRPVLSPYGWHLIFVQDRQSEVIKSFKEVRREIETELFAKHLRRAKFRLIKQLRDEGDVKMLLEP